MIVGGIMDPIPVWRYSHDEIVRLAVRQDALDRFCSNPWDDPRCSGVPCGDFRDRCVAPATYTYVVRGWSATEEGRGTIAVTDSGDPCWHECQPVVWTAPALDGHDVRVTLLARSPGLLRRWKGSHPEQADATELGTIDPVEFTGRCPDPARNGDCCMPCAQIVDRCIAGDASATYAYDLAPADGSEPVVRSSTVDVPAEPVDCEPSWEIVQLPAACASAADGDALPVQLSGGGCACAVDHADAARLFVLVFLVLGGLFALRRDSLAGRRTGAEVSPAPWAAAGPPPPAPAGRGTRGSPRRDEGRLQGPLHATRNEAVSSSRRRLRAARSDAACAAPGPSRRSRRS